MTHYALATSPFGNFAVFSQEDSDSFYLIPIGELAEIPSYTLHDGITGINHDVLKEEATRQVEAAGRGVHPFFTPRPEYTINRATYTSDLEVGSRTYSGDPTEYVYVTATSSGLTESAKTKLTNWWLSVRDSVTTPEFWALTELERAKSADHWARRSVAEAREALAEAEAKMAEVSARLSKAEHQVQKVAE